MMHVPAWSHAIAVISMAEHATCSLYIDPSINERCTPRVLKRYLCSCQNETECLITIKACFTGPRSMAA